MVGDSLDIEKMRNIVRNLATLKHPWNCPHGRPTMRLISNFQQYKIKDFS